MRFSSDVVDTKLLVRILILEEAVVSYCRDAKTFRTTFVYYRT